MEASKRAAKGISGLENPMKSARPRLNGKQRTRIYLRLVERDGEYCKICLCDAEDKRLQIDRKNSKLGYGELSNLQLLCSSCNSKKDPRGKATFTLRRVRTSEEMEKPRVTSMEMYKNLQSEPKFREWLWRSLMKRGAIALSEVLNSGAELCHCSQQTIKRYVDKMSSTVGACEIKKSESGVAIVCMRHDPSGAEQVMDDALDTKRLADEVLSNNGSD